MNDESRLDDRTEWVHRMLNYGKDVPLTVRWYVEDVPMLREKVEALDIALRASGERREKAERLLRQMSEIYEITEADDAPVAWDEYSYPFEFKVGIWGVEYPDGLPTSRYLVTQRYCIRTELYSVAVVSPEWDVFV